MVSDGNGMVVGWLQFNILEMYLELSTGKNAIFKQLAIRIVGCTWKIQIKCKYLNSAQLINTLYFKLMVSNAPQISKVQTTIAFSVDKSGKFIWCVLLFFVVSFFITFQNSCCHRMDMNIKHQCNMQNMEQN